tara:strand:+ start:566 stop:928 length:363 start_codon:yes stop_codon:yes gene_type:complete
VKYSITIQADSAGELIDLVKLIEASKSQGDRQPELRHPIDEPPSEVKEGGAGTEEEKASEEESNNDIQFSDLKEVLQAAVLKDRNKVSEIMAELDIQKISDLGQERFAEAKQMFEQVISA